MRKRPEDPCERAVDELTPDHVREVARELRLVANRLSGLILQRAPSVDGLEFVVLADLAGSALEQLDCVTTELAARGTGEIVARHDMKQPETAAR